ARASGAGGWAAPLPPGGSGGPPPPPASPPTHAAPPARVPTRRRSLAGLPRVFLRGGVFGGRAPARARLSPGWLPDDREAVSLAVILRSLVDLWPLAILMFAVLGTIYMGIATPTEAASLGVVAAIALGFTVGELTMKGLLHALIAAVRGFGAIALIFLGASILSQAISILGLPAQLAQTMGAMAIGKYELLLGIVLLYLVLGCLFDGISIMLMTLPLTFPLMMNVGFDPVWYGIVVTVLIEIGMITPPVGINLFVLVSLTKGAVNITEAAWEAIPYWLLMLVAIALFTLFPGIVTGLPNLFY
ncbi:TRAP transporter large permease subunit, partial [Azospirillum brasilense]|nr:TRAP transporter large permease subunit [Azospirillum brasilense]